MSIASPSHMIESSRNEKMVDVGVWVAESIQGVTAECPDSGSEDLSETDFVDLYADSDGDMDIESITDI